MNLKLIKQLIKEELLRGFPDFILDEAADEACKTLKRGLMKSINQRSISPQDKRMQLQTLDKKLKQAKAQIRDCLADIIKELSQEI
jgi:hypothetical protein